MHSAGEGVAEKVSKSRNYFCPPISESIIFASNTQFNGQHSGRCQRCDGNDPPAAGQRFAAFGSGDFQLYFGSRTVGFDGAGDCNDSGHERGTSGVDK